MKLGRRDFLKAASMAAVSAGLGGCSKAFEGFGRGRKPNFVVIFTDDQGYQDVGCFGSPLIKTPNLDRMRAEGVKLTDFYSAAPVCTPSRAALMTGSYPMRVGLPGVLFPQSTIGINSSTVTVAEVLKQRGYKTACVGKWHLGHHRPFLPINHGFDSYFGLPYSNDMRPENPGKRPPYPPLPLMSNEQVIEENPDQRYLTKRYTDQAVDFIKRNADRPFFLYLAHTMPHVPLYASENFKDTSERGLYGDVIEEVDWSAGQILDTLRSLSIAENTFVLFTSDNGPWLSKGDHGGCALPLRDGKGTTYEGGMREPAIAWWPGKIKAGSTCSEVCATMDVLPTFASLAGAEAPEDIDGKNIWPLLAGKESKSPHEAFFYWNRDTLVAVRCGNWKLRRTNKVELYNLAEDISEQNNLAEKHPDIVEKLTDKLENHKRYVLKTRRRPGKI